MVTQNSLNITDTGIIAADGAGTFTGRSVAGTTDFIDVANANGTAGNPTLSIATNFETTGMHTWNGVLTSKGDTTVTSDGATITLSVEKNGGGDLVAVFSDGYYDWDCTPAATVTLTAGTDTAPQINYVYLLQSTKTLTASTVGWPATECVRVSQVICQSAASLQTQGPYGHHQYLDDCVEDSQQGHVTDVTYWIRQQDATYHSGIAQTYTITPNAGSADNVILTTAVGEVLQLHINAFPAFAGTPDVYVINDSVTPYTVITDLNAALTDSTGASMSGKYFSLVIWGIVNQNTGDCKLFLNLPSGSYSTQAQLDQDVSSFTNYNIPITYMGVGFLISEWKLRHQIAANGTWTSIEEIDLRGTIPSVLAGGGSATISEFVDTAFRVFDDGDDSKELAFECSGITTATTRTLTVPDADGTITVSFAGDSGTATPTSAGAVTVAGGTGITTAAGTNTVTVNLDTPVAETNGGTGQTTYTTGDILYASAANTLSKLIAGASGDVLTSNGAGVAPSYQTPTVGTVTSVSGTLNRITSTGGATPVIDIDASYVGQSSITTLGTITTGTWNATDIAVPDGGTGLSATTAYAVLCGGTTSTAALQSIASVGTSGDVLTSNGAGALPTFQAAAGGGGGWVFLASATASASATLDFASSIDSTYFLYAFVINALRPATDNVSLYLRTSSNGGSTYDSGASDYLRDANTPTAQVSLANSLANDDTSSITSGIVYVCNPSLALPVIVSYKTAGFDETTAVYFRLSTTDSSAMRYAASIVDAVRFYMSSGNITSGTIKMYGLATPS